MLFTNWGENMNFPPFFHPLLVVFFPNMLFGHILAPPGGGGGVEQKIYTPAHIVFMLAVGFVLG